MRPNAGIRTLTRQKSNTVTVLEWLLPARRDTKGETGQRGLGLLWRTVWSSHPGTPTHLYSAKVRYNADKANENTNKHS